MNRSAACLRRLRLACASALCAVLAACALPKPPEPSNVAVGSEMYTRWGRFALRVETATGEPKAVQGGFAWHDDGRVQMLDLTNPLGTTLARVLVDENEASLTRADGSKTWAANPDALLAQVLGSAMPVTGLRDWLRGRVNEGAKEVRRDSAGRPEHVVQDNWQVWLSRYDARGPRLLRIERRDADELIAVRLVID